MSSDNRKDFSFDLWGSPADADYDGNRVTFKMNPKYGKGKSILLDSDTKVYPNLAEYSLSYKIRESNKLFYKTDSIWLGKILSGRLLMKNEDDENILFNEGDIFCISGNYILNQKVHFNYNESVSLIGVFGYHNELLDIFEKNTWDKLGLEKALDESKLSKGIKLNKTNQIEKIISDLHIAMTTDDRYMAFIKSNELLNCFINMMQNKEHNRIRTYTEQQVDEVIKIKNFLDENLDKYYSMPKLAKMFNISLSRMQSIFKEYYNLSPYRYHLYKRLEKAKDLIINTDLKTKAIARSVGFTSYDNFFKAYKNRYKCNPSKDRKK